MGNASLFCCVVNRASRRMGEQIPQLTEACQTSQRKLDNCEEKTVLSKKALDLYQQECLVNKKPVSKLRMNRLIRAIKQNENEEKRARLTFNRYNRMLSVMQDNKETIDSRSIVSEASETIKLFNTVARKVGKDKARADSELERAEDHTALAMPEDNDEDADYDRILNESRDRIDNEDFNGGMNSMPDIVEVTRLLPGNAVKSEAEVNKVDG